MITAYSFEEIVLSLALVDKKTNNVVALHKHSSLEDIDALQNTISFENDMVSYIEARELYAGAYRLEIRILKSLFLQRKGVVTCIGFDLMIEYVPISPYANGDQFEIVSVIPYHSESLNKDKVFKVQLEFQKEFQITSLQGFSTQDELKELFYLQKIGDSKMKIVPDQILDTDKTSIAVFFNFKHTDFGKQQPD